MTVIPFPKPKPETATLVEQVAEFLGRNCGTMNARPFIETGKAEAIVRMFEQDLGQPPQDQIDEER
jgi:hypothetical protein